MLPFLAGRDRPQGHPLLSELVGQTIVHTRVAARGTWTVTARGWVVHSRIQQLEHPGRPDPPEQQGARPPGQREVPGRLAVGLRDPRLLGAQVSTAEMLPGGQLTVSLTGRGSAPLRLSTVAPWRLEGPRGALLTADEKGELSAAPPGAPRFATPGALAEHAASRASDLEQRLLQIAQGAWLHPGHVVAALAASGALRDQEFERRGPILLARMLARGELRAGFVTDGSFSPWPLSTAEVVEHVGATWTAIGGRTPSQDMIAWFELTDVGRDRLGPAGPQSMPPGMSGYDSPGVVGGFR